MTDEQLRDLAIAIRRLLEGSRDAHGTHPSYVLVQRIDWDRLNRLAADLP